MVDCVVVGVTEVLDCCVPVDTVEVLTTDELVEDTFNEFAFVSFPEGFNRVDVFCAFEVNGTTVVAVLFTTVEFAVLFTEVILVNVEFILIDELTFKVVVTLALCAVTLLVSLTQCSKDLAMVMLLQCLVKLTRLPLHRRVTFS